MRSVTVRAFSLSPEACAIVDAQPPGKRSALVDAAVRALGATSVEAVRAPVEAPPCCSAYDSDEQPPLPLPLPGHAAQEALPWA